MSSKLDGLAFTPGPECDLCPADGCDLTCCWPREQEPLTWDGDQA